MDDKNENKNNEQDAADELLKSMEEELGGEIDEETLFKKGVKCPTCGESNELGASSCSICEEELTISEDDIDELLNGTSEEYKTEKNNENDYVTKKDFNEFKENLEGYIENLFARYTSILKESEDEEESPETDYSILDDTEESPETDYSILDDTEELKESSKETKNGLLTKFKNKIYRKKDNEENGYKDMQKHIEESNLEKNGNIVDYEKGDIVKIDKEMAFVIGKNEKIEAGKNNLEKKLKFGAKSSDISESLLGEDLIIELVYKKDDIEEYQEIKGKVTDTYEKAVFVELDDFFVEEKKKDYNCEIKNIYKLKSKGGD